jgi:hypothetical protein
MAISQRIVPYPYSATFKGYVGTEKIITDTTQYEYGKVYDQRHSAWRWNLHTIPIKAPNVLIINLFDTIALPEDTLPLITLGRNIIDTVPGGGFEFLPGFGYGQDKSYKITNDGIHLSDEDVEDFKITGDGIVKDEGGKLEIYGVEIYDGLIRIGESDQEINFEGGIKYSSDDKKFYGSNAPDNWVQIDNAFDGNRSIRPGITGISGNYGTGTIQEFIEAVFFTTVPTITLLLNLSTSNIVKEVGTTTTVAISGITTNTSGLTLSNGTVNGMINPIEFDDAETYGGSISFIPRQLGGVGYTGLSYSFYTTQDYTGTISGTATSATRTLNGVYPYFTLISETDYSVESPTDIYDAFKSNKSIILEVSSKAVSYTGTGYIYFLQDDSYDVITQILNPSLLDEFLSFGEIPITITSTDLDVDYVAKTYKMYKSKTIKYGLNGYIYTFIQ